MSQRSTSWDMSQRSTLWQEAGCRAKPTSWPAACAAAGQAEAGKPGAARGAQMRVVSFETSQGQKGPQADNVHVI
jgi:hypothetical protein